MKPGRRLKNNWLNSVMFISGISLRAWAREQIEAKYLYEDECRAWFDRKSGRR